MGKLIISEHISLDGFVGGPNGEMDWIRFDDEMFDFVGTFTRTANLALFGRNTFDMMEGYWPTAAQQQNASKHDKEHAEWYNNVNKIVFSNSQQGNNSKMVRFINDSMLDVIAEAKQQTNIIVFGSPGALQTLFANKLVDEMYLFVNPVLLGTGISLFRSVTDIQNWQLKDNMTYDSNVIALHYSKA